MSDEEEYKAKYLDLKNKIKILLYEQCIYEDDIQKTEERLLKVYKDNNFLIERLAEYEKNNMDDLENSFDSDATDMSEDEKHKNKGSTKQKPISTSSYIKSLTNDVLSDTLLSQGHVTTNN